MPATERRSAAVERATQVGFAMIDKHVIWDESLPQNVKSVYTYLATYCGNTRTAFPSRSTIARRCGISVRSVDKAVKIAEACGLFVIQRKKVGKLNKPNLYLLLDFGGYRYGSGPIEVTSNDSQDEEQDDAEDGPHGATTPFRGGAGGAPPSAGGAVPGAPVAPYQDQVSRPSINTKNAKTSPPVRHRSTERRRRKIEAQIKKMNHEQVRAWELEATEEWWFTYDTESEELEEQMLAYLDSKWGLADGDDNMVTAMLDRGEDLLAVLNAGLKSGRWIDYGEPLPTYTNKRNGPVEAAVEPAPNPFGNPSDLDALLPSRPSLVPAEQYESWRPNPFDDPTTSDDYQWSQP